jgi:hypothetical protein
MKNVFRDEAVAIAEQRINEARSRLFAAIVTDTLALPAGRDCPATFAVGVMVRRDFRNIIDKDFCTNMTVTNLGTGDNKQVNIRVIWNWKGEAFNHTLRPDKEPGHMKKGRFTLMS